MKKLFVFFLVIALVFFTVPARAVNISNNLGMYFYSENIPVSQGNYYYVCSAGSADGAGSDNYEGTDPRQPLATINAAIDKCTAASETSGSEYCGDVIVVLPWHTEDLDAATDLVPDIAGLYIIGLGEGENRPRIDFTDTDGIVAISGAGTTIENIIFENQIDNVVENLDIGADDITLKNIVIRDKAGTSGKIFIMLDGTNTADRFKCYDSLFTHISGTENGDVSIEIDDAQDGIEIKRCTFIGDCDEAPIISDAAFTNSIIANNLVENTVADGFAIELTGAATGFLVDNKLYTDDYATALDPGSMKCFGNEFSFGVDTIPIYIPPLDGRDVGMGPYVAKATTASTTSIVDETFANFPNDYFNNGWTAYVIEADNSAPQGEGSDITDFATGTGTFTVNAYSSALAATDKVLIYFDQSKVAINADNTPIADSLSDILHQDNSYTYDLATDSLEAISEVLWGPTGIAAYPTAAAYTNDVSIAEVLAYVQDGVRNGSGQGLPSNKSLYDIIGETYIDDAGGDHLDDVYAHLNLIMKYTADGTGGGAVVGANLPAGKSLFDIIGETYTDDGGADHLDDVASHLNLISKYIADGDGDCATGQSLPSNKSLFDVIGETYTDDAGADHLDDVYSHLNTVVNPHYGASNYVQRAYDFDSDANAAASHNLYTVTGDVRIRLLCICNSTVTSGGTPTIEVGISGSTASIIAQCADATGIAAGEIWHDANVDSSVEAYSVLSDFIVVNDNNILLTIGTAACTGGILEFNLWWEPLTTGSTVVAGT